MARKGGYQAPIARAASLKINGIANAKPIADITQMIVIGTGRPRTTSGDGEDCMVIGCLHSPAQKRSALSALHGRWATAPSLRAGPLDILFVKVSRDVTVATPVAIRCSAPRALRPERCS